MEFLGQLHILGLGFLYRYRANLVLKWNTLSSPYMAIESFEGTLVLAEVCILLESA